MPGEAKQNGYKILPGSEEKRPTNRWVTLLANRPAAEGVVNLLAIPDLINFIKISKGSHQFIYKILAPTPEKVEKLYLDRTKMTKLQYMQDLRAKNYAKSLNLAKAAAEYKIQGCSPCKLAQTGMVDVHYRLENLPLDSPEQKTALISVNRWLSEDGRRIFQENEDGCARFSCVTFIGYGALALGATILSKGWRNLTDGYQTGSVCMVFVGGFFAITSSFALYQICRSNKKLAKTAEAIKQVNFFSDNNPAAFFRPSTVSITVLPDDAKSGEDLARISLLAEDEKMPDPTDSSDQVERKYNGLN